MTPRINISSRNGRMIWVRIRIAGSVSRLANTAPALRRGCIGRAPEDKLVRTAVLWRERGRHDRVRAGVASCNPDWRLRRRAHALPRRVVMGPLVKDPAADAVRREAAGRHHRRLIAAAGIALAFRRGRDGLSG